MLLKEEQKTNLPISIRIIDGNFFTCFDAFADEDDSLLAEPYEAFELAVGCAGMVYKSCVVAGFPLPDLVDCAVGLAYHDILVFHSWEKFLMLVRVSFSFSFGKGDVVYSPPLSLSASKRTRGNLANEFANGRTLLKGTACEQSIILAVGSSIHLNWY